MAWNKYVSCIHVFDKDMTGPYTVQPVLSKHMRDNENMLA